MHQVHIGLAPSHLRECVTASSDIPSRPRLRSTISQWYECPRTRLKFGERSFSCAGPKAWNSLPSSLQELTDTKTFKRKLKTFLFQQAYNWTLCSFIPFVFISQRYSLCNPLVNFITVRLHVMQRTVLLSQFCLSVCPSICLSVCLSVRRMRVLWEN